MVSPIQSGTSTTSFNRGFIPEETVVAAGPGNTVMYYRPFWRPVIAGSLFAISVFVLSWFLMLGFHVGIERDGVMALGGGVAVWLWITACVAYFFGGMIASAMTASPRDDALSGSMSSAWLKGAVIWGVSIPLGLVLYAFIAQYAGGLLPALNLPHPGILENSNAAVPHLGLYWSLFIGLACALVFSLIGSVAGCARAKA